MVSNGFAADPIVGNANLRPFRDNASAILTHFCDGPVPAIRACRSGMEPTQSHGARASEEQQMSDDVSGNGGLQVKTHGIILNKTLRGMRSLLPRRFGTARRGLVYFASTICVACSVATCSATRKPRAGRSMPANIASPLPSTTGEMAKCSSSIRPACRY